MTLYYLDSEIHNFYIFAGNVGVSSHVVVVGGGESLNVTCIVYLGMNHLIQCSWLYA